MFYGDCCTVAALLYVNGCLLGIFIAALCTTEVPNGKKKESYLNLYLDDGEKRELS